MAWKLLARGPDRSVLGALEGFEFKATLRLNEVGSWSLDLPREAAPVGWPVPGAGLIAVRDERVVASGLVDEESYAWSADPTDPATGPGAWSLAGDTDLARIGYRIVYPTPSAPWGGQPEAHFAFPFDGTKANGEEVLRVLMNHQAGSLAPTARRVSGLRLGPATGAGSPTRVVERFTPLLDALRKVAHAAGGLVFDITDTLDGALVFAARAPVDRTATARFGVELGNLRSLTVRRVSPAATTALIAGAGRKTERELVEYPDPGSDPAWARREAFVDQRQVDPALPVEQRYAEYAKAADELFTNNGEKTSVAAVITDTPQVAWGRDYQLGDLVAVLTPYGPVADVVRQVDITVDATGVEDITSTIGAADPATGDPLAAVVRDLTGRISRLEHD